MKSGYYWVSPTSVKEVLPYIAFLYAGEPDTWRVFGHELDVEFKFFKILSGPIPTPPEVLELISNKDAVPVPTRFDRVLREDAIDS